MSSLHETQANDYGNCIDTDTHFHDDDGSHEELEAMAVDWERRENDRAADEADEAQASAAMADVPADAGASTAAIIASGAVAAVDAIAALFERRVS